MESLLPAQHPVKSLRLFEEGVLYGALGLLSGHS